MCQPICGNIKALDSVEFSEKKCFKRFSASDQLYSEKLECLSDNGIDSLNFRENVGGAKEKVAILVKLVKFLNM